MREILTHTILNFCLQQGCFPCTLLLRKRRLHLVGDGSFDLSRYGLTVLGVQRVNPRQYKLRVSLHLSDDHFLVLRTEIAILHVLPNRQQSSKVQAQKLVYFARERVLLL